MRALAKLARKYLIPCIFILLALDTVLGDPSERILKSVPIIPGPYQYEIAAGFAAIGLVLAFIVWRYQAKGSGNE